MFEKVKLIFLAGRPKQWTKNLVVFAALIFSGELFNLELLAKTLLAFVSLCFLSSSIYIFNDIIDYEKDLHHPKKKLRPIASGRLSMKAALVGGIFFLALATLLGIGAGKRFLLGAGAYLVLQVAYSLLLKYSHSGHHCYSFRICFESSCRCMGNKCNHFSLAAHMCSSACTLFSFRQEKT